MGNRAPNTPHVDAVPAATNLTQGTENHSGSGTGSAPATDQPSGTVAIGTYVVGFQCGTPPSYMLLVKAQPAVETHKMLAHYEPFASGPVGATWRASTTASAAEFKTEVPRRLDDLISDVVSGAQIRLIADSAAEPLSGSTNGVEVMPAKAWAVARAVTDHLEEHDWADEFLEILRDISKDGNPASDTEPAKDPLDRLTLRALVSTVQSKVDQAERSNPYRGES